MPLSSRKAWSGDFPTALIVLRLWPHRIADAATSWSGASKRGSPSHGPFETGRIAWDPWHRDGSPLCARRGSPQFEARSRIHGNSTLWGDARSRLVQLSTAAAGRPHCCSLPEAKESAGPRFAGDAASTDEFAWRSGALPDHLAISRSARSDRPDRERDEANKEAVAEHAVFAGARDQREEGDDKGERAD